MSKDRQKGVTLVELLIAVVIIGVLSAIAYPSYQNYVLKGHRTAAKADLMMWQLAFEEQRTQNQSYISSAAKTIDTICPNCTNNNSRYNFSVSAATVTTYTLLAIATDKQKVDGCLKLTLKHTGETGQESPSNATCW